VKGGRVTERGTHDELMKLGGEYLYLVLLPFLFIFLNPRHFLLFL